MRQGDGKKGQAHDDDCLVFKMVFTSAQRMNATQDRVVGLTQK